jgi:hypothetical protein
MNKTFYFYSKPEKKKSRLSIAGVYNPESGLIKIGLAQCNQKDIFIKKFGRMIAEKRAVKHPIVETFINEGENPGVEFVNICRQLAYTE